MVRIALVLGMLIAATTVHAAQLKLKYFGNPLTGTLFGSPYEQAPFSGGFVFDLDHFGGTLADKSVSFHTSWPTYETVEDLWPLGIVDWTFSIRFDGSDVTAQFKFDENSQVESWYVISLGYYISGIEMSSDPSGDRVYGSSVDLAAPPGYWKTSIVPLPFSGVALFSALGALAIGTRQRSHCPVAGRTS